MAGFSFLLRPHCGAVDGFFFGNCAGNLSGAIAPLAKNSHCFKLHRPAAIFQSRSYGFSRFVENSCDIVKRTSLSVRL